ncbi:AMP-binding protein [Acetobacter oeni]|nr:AMP-binding protein [Acetobacter oeni]
MPLPDSPVQTLSGLLTRAATQKPDAVAIDFLGRRTNYRDLFHAAEHAAAGLQAAGMKKGDRIGLCLPNIPYSVIMFFAAQKIGVIVVNINPLYVEHEIHQVLLTSGVSVLVVTDLAVIARPAIAATRECPIHHIIVCPFTEALPWGKSFLFRAFKSSELVRFGHDSRLITFHDLIVIRALPVPVVIDPLHDVAVLQFTGGTSGTPKAAMLTHGNLLANLGQISERIGEALAGPQVILGVLPLFHVFAMMTVMLLATDRMGTMVLLPRFDAQTTLDTILRTKVTVFPAVPTILTALLRQKTIRPGSFQHMTAVISGGAPLPVTLRKQFEEAAHCPVIEGYGLSETSPVITFNPLGASRDGSCGLPVAGTELQIREISPPHALLSTGQSGEVWVRGPQVMPGYWAGQDCDNPFSEDGFLRTGDVGYLDEDGYLYLVDRLKDIIICGGYNVYPHVIEEALYRHPAVLEVLVIGVPDDYRGQAPKAFVVLKDGMRATERELLDHVGQFVSKIERPREIVFRETLPKTLIGKLSRKDLIARESLYSNVAPMPERAVG